MQVRTLITDLLFRADPRFAPSQWETSLQSNGVSHWLDANLETALTSGWNCQPWPNRSQNWMFVHSIIILSNSQQFPTSSSQNQVELGEWATRHFMHCLTIELWDSKIRYLIVMLSCCRWVSMTLVNIGWDNGLSPLKRPCHYLNKCSLVNKQTLQNKISNRKQTFIQQNTWKLSAIVDYFFQTSMFYW